MRTICPAEISLRPLLAARAVHLPLSVALFWLGSTVPVQAVQTFTTLTERVVVLRRVPLDCALLAFVGLRYGLSGNRVVTMVTGQREHERGTTSIGDERMLPGKTNPT